MASRGESGLLKVPQGLRGVTYMTVDELVPYGDESVEVLMNDELFYHA